MSGTSDRTGQVVAVASFTGGSGKTFFSTSLAGIAASNGYKAVLVDLDLHFGDAAMALQIRPQLSLYDGLFSSDGKRLLAKEVSDRLATAVFPTDLGFGVLAATRDPVKAGRVKDSDLTRAVKTLRALYDLVVIDTSAAPAQVIRSVLAHSDVVVLLATLDVPSLKNLKTFGETLTKEGIGQERQRLVLNKVQSDMGLDLDEVKETFDDRFVGLIPTSNVVPRAINDGTVVTMSDPKSDVARVLMAVASTILPAALAPAEGGEEARGKKRLFGRKGEEA